MKTLPLFFSILFNTLAIAVHSQNGNPVTWTFQCHKLNNDTVEFRAIAKIPKGWHIYSLYNEGGPGPTSFSFEKKPELLKVGITREMTKPEKMKEPLFDAYVSGFAGKAEFSQQFSRKADSNPPIEGTVKFFACNGKLCLPPKELKFSIPFDNKASGARSSSAQASLPPSRK